LFSSYYWHPSDDAFDGNHVTDPIEVQKVRIEREADEAGMANDLAGLQTAIAKRLHCFNQSSGGRTAAKSYRWQPRWGAVYRYCTRWHPVQ